MPASEDKAYIKKKILKNIHKRQHLYHLNLSAKSYPFGLWYSLPRWWFCYCSTSSSSA